MQKISIITGATGFIGKRFLDYLLNKDYFVRSISRSAQVHQKNIMPLQFDITNKNIPNKYFNGAKYFFHLAGIAHDTSNNKKNQYLYKEVNIDSTIYLAEKCIKNKVENFVFVSSSKAYYYDQENNYNSNNVSDIYGFSKKSAELKLIKLFRNSGMKLIIIRPPLVYGEGVKGNLKLMIKGIDKGWFPSLPCTNNIKSLVHVDDLVEATFFLINNNKNKEIVHTVTDGQNYSSSQIYKILCHVLDRKESWIKIPLWFFKLIGFFYPRFGYKVNKLFSNEFYSSEKINILGFKPKFKLSDIFKKGF